MAVIINGTTGITYPAGGTDNVASVGVGTTDVQTLTNKTITMGGLLNLGSIGQIQFPATQNSAADANTLDDYEEGTWTPVYSTGTFTYSTQNGQYTKVGNLVTVQCYINTNSASGSGQVNLTGLPFPVVTNTRIAVPIQSASWVNAPFWATIDGNSSTTTVLLAKSKATNGNFTYIQVSDFQNSSGGYNETQITCTYRTN